NLAKRDVERGGRPVLIQAIDLDVAHYSNYFARDTGKESERDVFADRIFIWPELPCERLTDKNGRWTPSCISAAEIAASQDRDMQRACISSGNDRNVDFRLL